MREVDVSPNGDFFPHECVLIFYLFVITLYIIRIMKDNIETMMGLQARLPDILGFIPAGCGINPLNCGTKRTYRIMDTVE